MADPVLVGGAALSGLVVMIACVWVGRRTAPVDRTGIDLDALAEPDVDAVELPEIDSPEVDADNEVDEFRGYVELKPPSTSGNVLLSLWRAYKHGRRQRKLARRGYIRWVRIKNGVWTDPAYVRPEAWVGSPFPIYRHDGGKYYFPRSAGVVDEATGMRTFVHRHGEAEPINLDESEGEVLDAEDLKQAEEMEVATAPPSIWDRLDLDLNPRTLLAAGIAGIMLLAGIQGFL
jgi:hypothetical protein